MCHAGLPEETQGHTGVGPANDCEGGPWIGASDMGGEAGGAGIVQPGAEKAVVVLSMCTNTRGGE